MPRLHKRRSNAPLGSTQRRVLLGLSTRGASAAIDDWVHAFSEVLNDVDITQLNDVDRINLRSLYDQLVQLSAPIVEGDGDQAEFERWLASCGVTKPDGGFDERQARLELSDYYSFLNDVSEVYSHVTRGRISKPNTRASEVISVVDEILEGEIEQALKD